MGKLVIIMTGVLALYLLPPVKEAYDAIYATATTTMGIELSDFEEAFFKSLPFVVLGMILFGTIWQLFKRKDGGQDQQ